MKKEKRQAERSPFLVTLGRNIRYMRQSYGLTQEELAMKMGTAQCHISDIESGLVNMTIATLASISECLGTNMQVIIGGHTVYGEKG